MNSWAERTCRTRCLVQSVLASAGALLAFAAAWPVVSQSCDDLAGPHFVQPEVLERVGAVSDLPHEFIDIACRDAVETGVVWEEIKKRGGVETSRKTTPFWAVPVGARVLLVRSPTRPEGRFVGRAERVEGRLASQFDAADRALLLPFAVIDADPRAGGVVLDVILLTAAGWLSFLTVRSVRRFVDPRRHPAIARLAADADLRDASKEVEREIASADAVRFRGREFTPSFFLDRRWPRFQLRRWTHLVWAHRQVTKHRVNFIPAGRTQELVLAFDDGTRLRLKQRSTLSGRDGEQAVVEALDRVRLLAPWAFIGFDDELERTWRKRRADLVAAVARRRTELASGRASAAS